MATTFEMFTPSTGLEHKDVPTEFVRIELPAAHNVVHRQATDADRAQYADEYAAFRAGLALAEPEVAAPLELPPAE